MLAPELVFCLFCFCLLEKPFSLFLGWRRQESPRGRCTDLKNCRVSSSIRKHRHLLSLIPTLQTMPSLFQTKFFPLSLAHIPIQIPGLKATFLKTILSGDHKTGSRKNSKYGENFFFCNSNSLLAISTGSKIDIISNCTGLFEGYMK